jgi:hypothetical protein
MLLWGAAICDVVHKNLETAQMLGRLRNDTRMHPPPLELTVIS